jgi:hypothetical protein
MRAESRHIVRTGRLMPAESVEELKMKRSTRRSASQLTSSR